jgi:beta-glucosidase
LSAKSLTANELLKVRVDVTNTGKVAGKEVVQLYVRDVEATVARPEKELKAFAKVELAPKQTKTITFTLDREAFWYFDVTRNTWMIEAGDFEILVGSSSRDIRSGERFTILPEPRATRLHTGLKVQTLLDDPDGRAIRQTHRRLHPHGRYEHGKRHDAGAGRHQSSDFCLKTTSHHD